MNDAFIRFMASPSGRAARVVAGTSLLAAGLARRQSVAGTVTSVLALVPLAAGAFDVCAIGPLLGVPIDGAAARASVS